MAGNKVLLRNDMSLDYAQLPSFYIMQMSLFRRAPLTLIDPAGETNKVRFEINDGYGRLTEGFSKLRDKYAVHNNCWILLKAVNGIKYQFSLYDDNAKEMDYNGWNAITNPSDREFVEDVLRISPFKYEPNSKILVLNENTLQPLFVATLTDEQSSGSKMVIPHKISKWLLSFGIDLVRLFGPVGEVACSIVDTDHAEGTAEFGTGWESFCTMHDVKEGDICTFKFNLIGERLVYIHIVYST